jgi:hypothetical protein
VNTRQRFAEKDTEMKIHAVFVSLLTVAALVIAGCRRPVDAPASPDQPTEGYATQPAGSSMTTDEEPAEAKPGDDSEFGLDVDVDVGDGGVEVDVGDGGVKVDVGGGVDAKPESDSN